MCHGSLEPTPVDKLSTYDIGVTTSGLRVTCGGRHSKSQELTSSTNDVPAAFDGFMGQTRVLTPICYPSPSAFKGLRADTRRTDSGQVVGFGWLIDPFRGLCRECVRVPSLRVRGGSRPTRPGQTSDDQGKPLVVRPQWITHGVDWWRHDGVTCDVVSGITHGRP